MSIGFAGKAMGAQREHCERWWSLDGYLLHSDGPIRVGRDPVPGDPRRPSPLPISPALASEFAAAGMPVRYATDLFARAA